MWIMRRTELSRDDATKRKEALFSAVGLWKDRTDLPDTEEYIRELRKDDRLRRIPSDALVGNRRFR
jgi:hypothetical protein